MQGSAGAREDEALALIEDLAESVPVKAVERARVLGSASLEETLAALTAHFLAKARRRAMSYAPGAAYALLRIHHAHRRLVKAKRIGDVPELDKARRFLRRSYGEPPELTASDFFGIAGELASAA